MWGLIALVTAISAGLGVAIDMGLRSPIVAERVPSPIQEQGQRLDRTACAEASALSRASSPAPRGPIPGENEPVVDTGESHDPQPADEKARRPATEPAGAPRPDEDASRTAALDPISLGRELFARKWLPNDPLCQGGDGLGPVYNATSCLECHGQGGPGGAGPAGENVELAAGVGYVFSPDKTVVVKGNVFSGNIGADSMTPDQADLAKIHPGFRDSRSAVLHRYGVDPEYSRWRANVREEFRDKCIEIKITARNPPSLFGAGLIDALADVEIERTAMRQPSRIRGRVSRLSDGRIGRFGWKAQVATLDEFVLRACANELGLEVPGHHQAASPLNPDAQGPGLDLTQSECEAMVAYVRSLPAPVSLDPSPSEGSRGIERGHQLFRSVGCESCHTADLGTIRGIYSDLLLHDLGPKLKDPSAYYETVDDTGSSRGASVSEWRTPPLWGFRDSGPYLHDGRAQTLDQAVALHGGQGAASAHKFRTLSDTDRSLVEAFLKRLVAPGSAGSHRVSTAPEAAVDTEERATEAPRHATTKSGTVPAREKVIAR
jgi:mono/diheme cytochrome c family protein